MTNDHEGHDEYQGHLVLNLTLVFSILATVAMAMRMFTRVHVIGTMGLDDSKYAQNSLYSVCSPANSSS